MSKRKHTHVQTLLREIQAMVTEEMKQREIAEHFGLADKYAVKRLLNCERRKEEKIAVGIIPRHQGRPRKDDTQRDMVAGQAYEINRLKMGNKLLRDFLQLTGRK